MKLLKKKRGIFYPIGEIRDKKYGLKLIDNSGRERNINSKGFQHF